MERVAFITGASKGIGQALVARFRAEGYRVAACSSSAERTKGLDADLKIACDVRDQAQVRAAIKAIESQWGRLDVLINNAGINTLNEVTPDTDDAAWMDVIAVNLHGTYYATKHALRLLPARSGRIINIASVLALMGVPDAIAYATSKHAVLGFTRSMAQKLAARGITVNAICPGWTRTDMALDRIKDLGLNEDQLKRSMPTGQWVKAEEVADLALFLARESSGSITGKAHVIDGGALP